MIIVYFITKWIWAVLIMDSSALVCNSSPAASRFQTMATMLAVHVLGCTGSIEERAALLHKIIQIAAELKTTMGNMFGFAAVMRALELPQVRRRLHRELAKIDNLSLNNRLIETAATAHKTDSKL